MEFEKILNGILTGDLRSLSKAITLIESKKEDDRKQAIKLQETLFNQVNTNQKTSCIRLGISGPPGVGKSTFIEALGMKLLENPSTKIAVIAIDPSSPVSHGSILGDKTRMQNLAAHERCFIRPSPSHGYLGGVTRRTREILNLCEMSGFDWIIIESVGVGQSEYVLASMVDLFCMLQLPNAGDELQAIKKGILELVDIILVNKADGENKNQALQSKVFFQNALHLTQTQKMTDEDESCFFEKQIFCVSSVEKDGLKELNDFFKKYLGSKAFKNLIELRRKKENRAWFLEEIENQAKEVFVEKFLMSQSKWSVFISEIEKNKISPNVAASHLIQSVEFSLKN